MNKRTKMNRKTYWTPNEFDEMIEKGVVQKFTPHRGSEGTTRYHISGTRIRWREFKVVTGEEGMEKVRENPTVAILKANMLNERTRQFNLLKAEYEKLYMMALEAGIVQRNGDPCPKCKSTNTSKRSQQHSTHEGVFVEAWLDCFDCEDSEYRGERF